MSACYGLNAVEMGGDAEDYDGPECANCGDLQGDEWALTGEYVDQWGEACPIYTCLKCGTELQ